MPIYEYQCQKCEHEFETIRKISDPPLVTCPACGTDSLKKLISKAAFRLKGGGWYETDFKSGSKKNVAGEEKKSGGGESATESSKGASEAPAKSASDSTKSAKSESSD
jgi:putative FmdB family regulatory protein